MKISGLWAGAVRSNLLFGTTALAAALAAFWLAKHYLASQAALLEQQFAQRLQTRQVLVAAKPLASGDVAAQGSLAMRDMPVSFLRSDALEPQSANSIAGRRVLHPRAAGDALADADFAPRSAPALAAVLPAGQRAFTMVVDEVAGQSGLLRAGDKVDVYWQHQRGSDVALVSLLLQVVPVLATGRQIAGQPSSGITSEFSTITLQVNADDAARLLLAQRTGQLAVVLRGSADAQQQALKIRDSRQLSQRVDGTNSVGKSDPPLQVIIGGSGAAIAPLQNLPVSPQFFPNGGLP
jgi:pilus assembly protein CpaB